MLILAEHYKNAMQSQGQAAKQTGTAEAATELAGKESEEAAGSLACSWCHCPKRAITRR